MNDAFFSWGGWITTVIVAIAGGLFSMVGKKGNLEHQLIDQLQEERSERQAEIAALNARIDALYGKLRIRDDYVSELRQQIENEEGPPPRPWPKELR